MENYLRLCLCTRKYHFVFLLSLTVSLHLKLSSCFNYALFAFVLLFFWSRLYVFHGAVNFSLDLILSANLFIHDTILSSRICGCCFSRRHYRARQYLLYIFVFIQFYNIFGFTLLLLHNATFSVAQLLLLFFFRYHVLLFWPAFSVLQSRWFF